MNAYEWAILAACIWGVVPVLEKIGLNRVEPYPGLFYRCLGVLLGFLIVGTFLVKPAELKQVDLKTILLLVLSGLLASFVAQIAFYHALKLGEVSRIVPISATYPLIAFLLGVIFLGENISIQKVFGMIMVLGGVWLLK